MYFNTCEYIHTKEKKKPSKWQHWLLLGGECNCYNGQIGLLLFLYLNFFTPPMYPYISHVIFCGKLTSHFCEKISL